MARSQTTPNILVDLTSYWNGKSWASRFPTLIESFVGWTNSLPNIVKAMNDDYSRYGVQTASMASRLQKLCWYYKFAKNPSNLLLMFTYISPFLKSFIPFYLTTGRTINLVHCTYKKCYILTLPPELLVLPEQDRVTAAFAFVQTYFIEAVAEDYVSAEQTRLCSEEQERANQTIEAAFGFTSDKRGPLSRGAQLRKKCIPLEQMLAYVEEWAPLYDIDVPSVTYNLPGYDTIKRFNNNLDVGTAKRSRVNTQIHAPHFTVTQTEATAAVECAYAQIIWYQNHQIQPDFVWVEDGEGNRTLHTQSEAKDLGNQSVIRVSDGSIYLQELFG